MLEGLIEQGDLPFSGNLEEIRMPFNDVLNEVSGLKGTRCSAAESIENILIKIVRRRGRL